MKKTTKIITSVLGVVLIAVAISANYHSKDSNNPEKIKVGVILPLSGQYASLGEGVKNSMEMSLKDLKGKNVELVYEDGAFDSAKAISAYNKLQSIDHADIIVGLDSPTLEAVKPVINKTDTLMLTVGNEATIEKDNVFEVIPWASALFREQGKTVSGKYSKVGLVYASDWALAAPNKKMFIEGLGSQAYTEVPVSSNSDMRTEVTKMLQNGIDAYTLFVPLDGGVKILNEIAKQSPKAKRPQLICDGNIELTIGDYLKKVNDKSVFDRCISVFLADTTDKEYTAKYKETYNTDPNFLGVYGYDAVQMISNRLVGHDKSDWKNILENKNFAFKGASGNITFDDTGSRTLQTQIDEYKDGKFAKQEQK